MFQEDILENFTLTDVGCVRRRLHHGCVGFQLGTCTFLYPLAYVISQIRTIEFNVHTLQFWINWIGMLETTYKHPFLTF